MNTKYFSKTYHTMGDAKLEKAWHDMEACHPQLSPFTYYDYMKHIFRQVKMCSLTYSPRIVCIESEQEGIVMIAPIKKERISGKVKMLGDIQGSGHADFLFKNGLSVEEQEVCIKLFIASAGRKYKLKRILETSPIYTFFTNHASSVCPEKTSCVSLRFPEDVDAHVKTLSSSVRQNLRTAYNRMRRNSVEYDLKVWLPGNRIKDDAWNDITKLYMKRLFTKYKTKKFGNYVYQAYKTLLYKYGKHDTHSLRSSANAFHAALYSQGVLMAFMSGYADHCGSRVLIPRLAINNDFRHYSPGYVLLNDTMHYLCAHTDIREIDLSRGTERYKTDLGGKLYFTYSFTFSKNF